MTLFLHILLGISLTMSSFNRRCYRCCISCLCNLGSERLPALLTIRLFGCLACVWGFVCRLSKYFSSVHSDVIVCAGDIRLLFKLLLKFRNVLKHTQSRSSLACSQNIKHDIPTALEVFLCFENKRNDIHETALHTAGGREI